jgi:hypothetical protein
MFKLLEKYKRYLLVAFVSLLMIVFLLPGIGGGGGFDPSQETLGTVNGREITLLDRRIAADELTLLNMFPMIRGNLPTDALQWILLIEEARNHGIYAGLPQGRAMTEQLLKETPEMAAYLRRQNIGIDQVATAMAHLQMVSQLQRMIVAAAHPSEPRLRHFAQDIRSQITLDAVAVDASQLVSPAPTATEEELKAHFEKYRDKKPGEGDYGIGYRFEPRVKLEYIAVPQSRVVASVRVDEVAAQKFYLENPDRFRPTPAPDAATGATPPAPADPPPYREVRQRVIDQLTQDLARDKQQKIVQEIVAAFSENARRLKLDAQGYRILDEQFQPLPLEDVAGQIQEAFGVLPDVIRIENNWLTRDDLTKLEGLGAATLTVNGQPVPADAYILSVRELDLPIGLGPLKLQRGIVSRPITANGSDYIFRVTHADAARPPHNLDEVRKQVEADVIRIKAWEQLKQQAPQLALRVKGDGSLDKLAAEFKLTPQRLGPFSGRDLQAMLINNRLELPVLPIVGQSQQFVSGAFDLTRQVVEAGGMDKASDAIKIAAIPVDKIQKVMLVKLVGHEPVDSASFDRMKMQLSTFMSQALQQELAPQLVSPLSLKALIQRTGFKYENPEDAQDESEEKAPASSGQTS